LYFPCREAAAAQPSADGVRHDLAPAARTELILTVDDNPTVLATAVLQLEALGYQTLTARNAETALEMLDRETKIDVLFTDIVMPTMNGRELAKLAQAAWAQSSVRVGFSGNRVDGRDRHRFGCAFDYQAVPKE